MVSDEARRPGRGASRRTLGAVLAIPATIVLGAVLAATWGSSLGALACWAVALAAAASIQPVIDEHARRGGTLPRWDRVGISAGFVRSCAHAADVSPSAAVGVVRVLWSSVAALWTLLALVALWDLAVGA